MKVRTNLTASELETVGKGLVKLSRKQRNKPVVLENNAEKELLRQANHALDIMLHSLQTEVANILLTDSQEGTDGEMDE